MAKTKSKDQIFPRISGQEYPLENALVLLNEVSLRHDEVVFDQHNYLIFFILNIGLSKKLQN